MSTEMLQAALAYAEAGYTIIPVNGKRAAFAWEQHQKERPTEANINEWFDGDANYGIAVVLGSASGGLICRDFDKPSGYERWGQARPELAKSLPTVETRPGRCHVYCRTTIEGAKHARQFLHKQRGEGAIKLGDGELRVGYGCYTVLPPSVHPDTGQPYRWRGLPAGQIPRLSDFPEITELVAAGLCERVIESYEHNQSKESIQSNDERKEPRSHKVGGSVKKEAAAAFDASIGAPETWPEEILIAILETQPEGPGQRNDRLFEFARRLKAIPALNEATLPAIRPYVLHWFERALPNIATKDFDETWFDFIHAWESVMFPYGEGPFEKALARALSLPLPDVAHEFHSRRVQLLIALCRELQRTAGAGPFFS